ncbi:MAG: phosphoglucosamine mutase [Pirellulaceae bacterium]|nr:phosphoglucosamine mutase [Pirellulaceae bacterium]
MKKPIISVSGLRGVIGESLSPIGAMEYVAAFASTLPGGPVVVTRDGRSSGPMLADGIRAALNALGHDVHYGDVAATPTTGVLVRSLKAVGGVQISASHNPPEYNGLKLFGADGRVVGAVTGKSVMDAMQQETKWGGYQDIADHYAVEDTTSEHLKLVLDTIEVAPIRERNYRVVLDSNHGAGSVLGRRLLTELNTEWTVLGDTPDGQFEHTPEPTADNLQGVAERAKSLKADVVFCQDPDADRLAIIDEHGHYVGEEYTLALTLKRRLMQQPGDCVINCATSRMSIDIAESFGGNCHLSAVGEANVCDVMHQVNAVYGGEGNGGPIDPKVGYVRDSFVAMAQVLELMAITGKSISELIEELPRYSIQKAKFTIDREKLPQVYEALQARFSDAQVSDLDGMRFDWNDRWLLVRPSNTEPIVRAICEAGTVEASNELVQIAEEVISNA